MRRPCVVKEIASLIGVLMKISTVDFKYKMKDILKALNRNESVKVYYRNNLCGILTPVPSKKKVPKVKAHPFFGMHKGSKVSVEEEMNKLRESRFEQN